MLLNYLPKCGGIKGISVVSMQHFINKAPGDCKGIQKIIEKSMFFSPKFTINNCFIN